MIAFPVLKTDAPLYGENRFGNFMYHPVRWGCKPGVYSILRKIISISVAIFLSFTVIGLFIVIPGIKEWNRQVNRARPGHHWSKDAKEFSLQTLVKFNNRSVNGGINGIYITTNESNLRRTHHLLETHPRVKQPIHIGCAAWYNLDVVCARGSEYCLIVDFNSKNADFIKKTIEFIQISESRDLFQRAIIDYLNSLKGNDRNLYFHSDQQGLPTDRIRDEALRRGSWLHTEESYLFIKNMVSNGRLVAITETITNSQTFFKIREDLNHSNIVIDTVYLSNICNFMKTAQEREAFVNSVKHIINENTIFISCPKLKHNSTATTILHQRPLLGREILEGGFNPERLFEETLSTVST